VVAVLSLATQEGVGDMDDARTTVLKAELEDAKRQRDRLNVYIEALSERLGIPVDDEQTQSEQPGVPAPSGPLTDDVESLVYENEFHGLKMPKAAEQVLRRWSPEPYRRPLKTTHLMKALQKGGLKIAEPRVLYRSLYTAPRIERLKGGQWGLAEWYHQGSRKPAAVKSNGSESGADDQPTSSEETDNSLGLLAEMPDPANQEEVPAP
jgi:hypothetical protein